MARLGVSLMVTSLIAVAWLCQSACSSSTSSPPVVDLSTADASLPRESDARESDAAVTTFAVDASDACAPTVFSIDGACGACIQEPCAFEIRSCRADCACAAAAARILACMARGSSANTCGLSVLPFGQGCLNGAGCRAACGFRTNDGGPIDAASD